MVNIVEAEEEVAKSFQAAERPQYVVDTTKAASSAEEVEPQHTVVLVGIAEAPQASARCTEAAEPP